MRTWRFVPQSVFLLIFVLLLALTAVCPAQAETYKAKWIPDGDTVLLTNGTWVRLTGIDTPETGKDGQPGQYYAAKARTALQKLLTGQELVLQYPGHNKQDRYKRHLAEIILPDGTNVNETMVRRGLAFYFWFFDHQQSFSERYVSLQAEAIAAGQGFWPHILSLPVSKEVWIGNAHSRRGFPAGSKGARKISRPNRREFRDLASLFRAGFCPARWYSPWAQ